MLIKRNDSATARTRYAVYAVKFKRSYIILNSSEANRVILNEINTRRFCFLQERAGFRREFVYKGYKTDIYLPKSNTVIEIKSIITTDTCAEFPSVYSERAIVQLSKLYELLKEGVKVCYILVSLNPYVKQIKMSGNTKLIEFKKLFLKCIEAGMQCKGYSVILKEEKAKLKEEIMVLL